MNEEITVNLGSRSYPIRIVSSGLDEVGPYLKGLHPPCRCAVVTDENVAPLYGEGVCESLREAGLEANTVHLPPGEKQKNLETIGRLYSQFLQFGLHRNSLAVALGGGVVGDITGFAAATFMRGITYVQVPTSLLAQVDSSVGGKTGVNLPEGKNLAGAFHQPMAVFADVSALKTLPERELKCGIVEVIKYGVIWDAAFFSFVEENLNELLALEPKSLIWAVRRCCEIKAEIVSTDERESGLRAILNYGHTVGHAVESLLSKEGLRHGEAVSAGTAAAVRIAGKLEMLPEQEQQRQIALLERLGTPTTLESLSADAILERMQHDKKALEGTLRLVLARGIGNVEITENVPLELLEEALRECGAD